MWLDAALAYLHFTAVFVLFAFLTAELMLARTPIDARAIRLMLRVDGWYGGAAVVVLATGLARLWWGAKGAAFYTGDWVFWAKMLAFAALGAISVPPTVGYFRWRRRLDSEPEWVVPEEQRRRLRRYLMMEVHLAAMIPIFAVVMARGLAR